MALLRSIVTGCRLTSRPQLFGSPLSHVRCVTLQSSQVKPTISLTHDDKNAKLSRPMSPHLTIYKPQLTSIMSISHRITGLTLTTYAFALSIASFMPNDIPHMVATVQSYQLPVALIMLFKFALAFPASYHLCNGIRHLVWDMGRGLTIKDVYMSGYITLASSLLLTIFLLTR